MRFLSLLTILSLGAMSSAQVYVSNSGDDAYDGRSEIAYPESKAGPKLTIGAAQEVARRIKQPVLIGSGTYHEVLTLDIRDADLSFSAKIAGTVAVDGIVGKGVRNTIVDGFKLAGSSISIEGTQVTVRNCSVSDSPGMGIYVKGGDWLHLTKGGNLIEACTATKTGKDIAAIRIEGVGNTVRGCQVFDVPHCGINAIGPLNTIEGNTVERACLQVDDMGGIYVGGFVRVGCIIRNNTVKDTLGTAGRYGGIYVDDMGSGVLVEGNTVTGCGVGLVVGGGSHNIIRNNKFEAKRALLMDARGTKKPYYQKMVTQQLGWIDAKDPIFDAWPWLRSKPEDSLTPSDNTFIGNTFVGDIAVVDQPMPVFKT